MRPFATDFIVIFRRRRSRVTPTTIKIRRFRVARELCMTDRAWAVLRRVKVLSVTGRAAFVTQPAGDSFIKLLLLLIRAGMQTDGIP